MSNSESKLLFSMLDDLIQHFEYDNRSLIARIYGVYTISTNVFNDVDIMIMQNTTSTINKQN